MRSRLERGVRSALTAGTLAMLVAQPAAAQSEMLIVDELDDRIVRFNRATGQFIDWFCVNHDGGLNTPNQAVYAPNGELYVTSYFGDRVRRHDGQTGQFLGELIAPGQGGVDGPTGLAIAPDGRVHVSCADIDSIKVYDPTLGTISTFIAPGNNLDSPVGIARADSDDWYVCSAASDRVLRYNAAGGFLDIAIAPGVFGLAAPVGVLIDEQQRMYVASHGSDSILVKQLATGTVSQLVAPGSGGLDMPRFLTLEPATKHLLVVAWGGNGQFLRFNRMNGTFLGSFLTPLAGGLSGDPDMVVFKPDATNCYADCDQNGVLDIDDFICFQTAFAIGC